MKKLPDLCINPIGYCYNLRLLCDGIVTKKLMAAGFIQRFAPIRTQSGPICPNINPLIPQFHGQIPWINQNFCAF